MVGYEPISNWYRVVYLDGDQEDMQPEMLYQCMARHPDNEFLRASIDKELQVRALRPAPPSAHP